MAQGSIAAQKKAVMVFKRIGGLLVFSTFLVATAVQNNNHKQSYYHKKNVRDTKKRDIIKTELAY